MAAGRSNAWGIMPGERPSFDPVGHYSRPDVTQLIVNRQRQSTPQINDRTE